MSEFAQSSRSIVSAAEVEAFRVRNWQAEAALRQAHSEQQLRWTLLDLCEAQSMWLSSGQELTFMWAEVEYSFKIPSTLRDQSCPCQLYIQPRAFPIRGVQR